jgi:hypothetical protein
VLGDHNLVRPGAIKRVVAALQTQRHLEVFYANFRCATYPDHWPMAAAGGYDGPYSYLANADTDDRPVPRWNALIQGGTSALCTQLYAHIVRRDVWCSFWSDRAPIKDCTRGVSIYPHTWMIAETLFQRPAFYIGDPVLTIFNGASSWLAPQTRAKVYLWGLPELLSLYAKKGLSPARLREAQRFAADRAYEVMLEILRGFRRQDAALLVACLRQACRYRYLWPPLWRAFLDSECCKASTWAKRSIDVSDRTRRYLLHDCRPARWMRSRHENQ